MICKIMAYGGSIERKASVVLNRGSTNCCWDVWYTAQIGSHTKIFLLAIELGRHRWCVFLSFENRHDLFIAADIYVGRHFHVEFLLSVTELSIRLINNSYIFVAEGHDFLIGITSFNLFQGELFAIKVTSTRPLKHTVAACNTVASLNRWKLLPEIFFWERCKAWPSCLYIINGFVLLVLTWCTGANKTF